MAIILCSKVDTPYSIEAGVHDGESHFDHHGDFNTSPSPCNNKDIAEIPFACLASVDISISHMDADTLIGLKRLFGFPIESELDLDLMEKIDVCGSSVAPDKYNPTLLWMLGVDQLALHVSFPRCTDEPQNVTDLVDKMIRIDYEDIVCIGKEAQDASEKCYVDSQTETSDDVIMFSINEDDMLDPSRAYEDGFRVVVVYRQHYSSCSIYVNPSDELTFADKTIAGVLFAGHPKACGSPRGQTISEDEASKVYHEIVSLTRR